MELKKMFPIFFLVAYIYAENKLDLQIKLIAIPIYIILVVVVFSRHLYIDTRIINFWKGEELQIYIDIV